MNRRTFLRNTALGVGAAAEMGFMGIEAEGMHAIRPVDQNGMSGTTPQESIGRPVRIVSIGFRGNLPLEKMAGHVDEEGARGADIIALPELARGLGKMSEESLDGPTVTTMSALAKKHRTYIACPIERIDGHRRLNSVVLLDRTGQVACVYDKVFPYWSEYDVHPPIDPGDGVQVHQADFGRVGFATCFDVNFPEVWRRLSDKGAELVIWPSAYSAGISLQAHAINHHYYIVSCSRTPDCIVYDITGERLLYNSDNDIKINDRGINISDKGINISRVTLDLDRCIYHENFNLSRRDKLLSEHPHDVAQDKAMVLEQWFVLRAKRPGISARDLARDYGLEELRHYVDRSRLAIDKRRGWEFAAENVFPNLDAEGLKAVSSFVSSRS